MKYHKQLSIPRHGRRRIETPWYVMTSWSSPFFLSVFLITQLKEHLEPVYFNLYLDSVSGK